MLRGLNKSIIKGQFSSRNVSGPPAFIVSASRTAIGSFNGGLSHLSGVELGTIASKHCLESAGIPASEVSEVIMGNVCSANVGQAPATQVAIGSGCSWSTPATSVNKVCASGMKAVMMGSQSIALGLHDCVLAGGFESMSNVPYYVPKARTGYKYGHGQLIDGILQDGLWDSFDQQHMGMCAEKCVQDYQFTREEQDALAISSYQRAIEATEKGWFTDEIAPIEIKSRSGTTVFQVDEELQKVNYEKIPTLKPAFTKDGSVTAANSSSLNDGAASLLLVSEAFMKFHRLEPLAKIISYADAAKKSDEFTTAPVLAIQKALESLSIAPENVDCWEINEAFSVVSLANQKLLDLNSARVNVHGGAVAMGHPIGASGARIIVSLMTVLRRKGGTLGVASICNGGGGASAIVIERLK